MMRQTSEVASSSDEENTDVNKVSSTEEEDGGPHITSVRYNLQIRQPNDCFAIERYE